MKIVSRIFLAVCLVVTSIHVDAQTKKKQPVKKKNTTQKTTTQKPAVTKPTVAKPTVAVSSDPVKDDKKVRDIVAFLQYMLNLLGSSSTTARDKDVMATESYSKIFNDAKVQIEDDLDDERETVTNKEVMAYLKDVDFFFTDAKFEFTIENIEQGTNANGKLFYKVSTTRNLKGTTSDGKIVNTNVPRFIEINYNPDEQDLKIVSIYTHEIDEKEALTNWWNGMSYEWQSLFKKKLNITDSVSLNNLKDITSIDTLDLSGNKYIQNIIPLSRLINLQALNLSQTTISDLAPIRNLTELKDLDLSYTPIQDISSLKYSSKLQNLNLQHSQITDISVITQMPGLHNLNLANTPVTDFSAISNINDLNTINLKGSQLTDLTQLQNITKLNELSLSNTSVQDLSPLKNLKAITLLNIDSSKVTDITALGNLDNLKILHANYTLISDLQPLQKLTHLEKIYVDKTNVKKDVADAFVKVNPKVLVVYNSGDLITWWSSNSKAWQDVLSKLAKISPSPSKEELASITNLDSVNVSGNSAITDLEALRLLLKIRVVIANKTSIKDLSPLKDHKEIIYLDISETDVSDLSVARQFMKLKELRADKSKIESLEALNNLTSLKKLYVDQTAIHDIPAREFLDKNHNCLLVYKTIHLNRWWNGLSPEWKKAIRKQMGTDTTSTRENLHRVAELETLHVENAQVNDFSGLSEFVRLKEFFISGSSISEIPVLENIKSLKSLHVTNGPLQRIDALSQLPELEDLDISNTPIDELKVIGTLKNLKSFTCAGTQVRRLTALEYLTDLNFLDCSNTYVSQLDPVSHQTLKTLKCYNTKVTSREIESFKKSNPECEVVYYR